MFFFITVATSIKIRLFDESILRDQAYSSLCEINILNITLLRGTNPDIQITQHFFKVFLLEARWWVQLAGYENIFSFGINSMNILPIGCYITVIGLNAKNSYICWFHSWGTF